ncbi:tail length tape measure protein [Bacillus phage Wes44]|uniref:Tail length tape measure protein n=1 Tax=Bacillus phage Wes44 TaxID=2283012 RepID=A0A346FK46_9CAUD|nr:tail length tape measure protein [Bacillus phage Wes44]AXN58351.1 tail length tape measure protein [Bacillus phage Wes44]
MADGRILIDSRIQTNNLRSDAQQVNAELDRMTRAISSSSNRSASETSRAFNSMRTTNARAMSGMANDTNSAYRSMDNTARQSYAQMGGYGQSAYRQQQEAARAAWSSMSAESRAMHREMKQAWWDQQMAMGPYRDAMMKAQYDYFKLTQASKTFQGTNAQFLAQVKEIGAAQKKAAEDAMKANELAKMSMIQQAGTMMNLSTQASKISANYDRMGSKLLQINRGGLAAADGLNKLANAGDASVLALKMLGPTANMKALTDMQNMIMQGQMRIGMVAMAAAATCTVAYGALWKAAKGPDPSTVFAEQEAALTKYKEAVKARTEEIATAWGLFEKIQLNKTSAKTLTQNLQEQVNAMTNWNANLNSIASRTSTEFANYLSQMGPKAAGEIAAISKMSQPELDNYVNLWQQKMNLARTRATTELEGLKAETMAKIKELGDTLTPLGLAAEKFKTVWAEALQPMVQAFTNVMTPVVNFATEIGKLIIKFNEANPTLALFIQGALMLIPALTLLLSPLAAGIGLWNGMLAALNAVWMLIGPLVTGLAAMSATVWVVAAAIAGLAMGFVYLWNNSETFRNGVIAGWEAIKAAALAVWNFILNNAIRPAMAAIGAFVGEKLAQIKQFWDENGAQIMQAATNAWNGIVTACKAAMDFLQPVFEIAWMIIKEVVIGTWENIKGVINGALNIIMGIVKIFTGLFTGDWDKLWEGVKQLWDGALEFIWNAFQLWGVGKIFGFLGKFVGKFAKYFDDVWKSIKGIWNDVITEIWFFFATKFEAIGNFGKAFMGTLKSMFEVVWNAIKGVWDTVLNGIKAVATTVWTGIKMFLEGIWNGLKAVFSTVWTGIKMLAEMYLNAMKAVYTTVWNAIKSTLTTIWNGLKTAFEVVWNAIKSVASTVMNSISSIFSTVWNAIKSVVTTVMNAIRSVIQSGMSAAQSIVSSIGNSIKSAFSSIWSGFSNVVSNTFNTVKNFVTSGLNGAVNIIKNFGNTFFNAGKGLIDMMAKGIKNAASAVTNAISDIASKARDFLPFSPAKTGPLSDIDKLDFGGPISDSINRATKGVQVKLSNMLDLPVISATATPMNTNGGPVITNNNGGNTNSITVNIDPSNMQEFEQVIEFFDTFKQKVRKRG